MEFIEIILKTIKYIIYICIITAIVLKYAQISNTDIIQFIFACFGLIPLAGMIGDATEDLGDRINPIAGGILSASFGNAPELIFSMITLFKDDLDDLIKASLIGSVISNTLLVLGSSIIIGGLKNGTQEFKAGIIHSAGFLMLIFASVCLSLPTLWKSWANEKHIPKGFNIAIPILVLICYALYTIFQIKGDTEKQQELENKGIKLLRSQTKRILFVKEELDKIEQSTKGINTDLELALPAAIRADDKDKEKDKKEDNEKKWHIIFPILQLIIASAFVALLSEIITDTVSQISEKANLSNTFIGIVIIAITGNAAEHWTAMKSSYDNETDLSITTVVTSALQITMFIMPLMILFGYLRDIPFELVFNPLELVIQGITVVIAWLIVADAKTNWLEGLVLFGFFIASCTLFFYV